MKTLYIFFSLLLCGLTLVSDVSSHERLSLNSDGNLSVNSESLSIRDSPELILFDYLACDGEGTNLVIDVYRDHDYLFVVLIEDFGSFYKHPDYSKHIGHKFRVYGNPKYEKECYNIHCLKYYFKIENTSFYFGEKTRAIRTPVNPRKVQ